MFHNIALLLFVFKLMGDFFQSHSKIFANPRISECYCVRENFYYIQKQHYFLLVCLFL